MISLLFILALSTFSPGAIAAKRADWFVDSVSGSDSNDGKSPTAAFSTISKLSTSIGERQYAAFLTGSSWREMFAPTKTNLTLFSYGSGARPMLDCSDIVTPTLWSKTGGYTSVYAFTLANTYTDSAFHTSLWENSNRFAFVADIATVDATASSYTTVRSNATFIQVYAQASDSSDPGANGKTYEVGARDSGLNLKSCTCVSGLHSRRNVNNNGSIVLENRARVVNCLAEDGSKHNLFTGKNSTILSSGCLNAYFAGLGSAMFIMFESAADTNSVTVYRDCWASNSTADPDIGSWYSHSSDASYFGYITFDGCSLTNVNGFAPGTHRTILVTNCLATNSLSLFGSQYVNGSTYTILNSRGYGANTRVWENANDNTTLIVSNCVFSTTLAAAMRTIGYTNVSVTITDSTLTSTSLGYLVNYTGANNTLYCRRNTYNCAYSVYAIPGIPDSDDNIFSSYGSPVMKVNGVEYATHADYTSATGQDTHSTW